MVRFGENVQLNLLTHIQYMYTSSFTFTGMAVMQLLTHIKLQSVSTLFERNITSFLNYVRDLMISKYLLVCLHRKYIIGGKRFGYAF